MAAGATGAAVAGGEARRQKPVPVVAGEGKAAAAGEGGLPAETFAAEV